MFKLMSDFISKCTLVVQLIVVIILLMTLSNMKVDLMTISSALQKELKLTQAEKNAFDKFKLAVYQNLTLYFLKEDLFLLRWIRAKNLDVQRAERDMFSMLNFLEKNKMEHILEEDFKYISEDFPISLNRTDRNGRPIGFISLDGNTWNPRRGILQGKRDRVIRYIYKSIYEVNHKIWETGRNQPSGEFDFKYVLLIDGIGFNPLQHSCPQCIAIYINLLTTYEKYFPGFAKDIIVINAPQTYVAIINLVRPFFSISTREALKVFNSNKLQWKPYLEERIDLSQFPDLS